MKAKKQDSTGIPTLNNFDGKAITEPTEKANVFNENFRSVFTTAKLDNFPSKSNSPYPSMPDFDITTQGVYNILHKLNPNKSRGLDKLHHFALKVTVAEISPMLTHTFQLSLSCGRLQDQCKHAYVTPIYKKSQQN